jgi:dihydrofolate reductase
MIKLIACVDRDMGIGKDNQLLTHLPKDLAHFKKTTAGHLVVFGKNTWDSLPYKPLSNRKNAVMTRDLRFRMPDVWALHHEEDVLWLGRYDGRYEHVFICGGETLYKLFLPYADELIISHMHADFESDTFFPNIGEEWVVYNKEFVEDKVNFDIKYYTKTKELHTN